MLSAVYTPKLAIVWGIKLLGLSCLFSKTNLAILWVWTLNCDREESLTYEMSPGYSELTGLYFSLDF